MRRSREKEVSDQPMILAFGEPNKTWQSIEDLESLTGGHRATVEDGNLEAARDVLEDFLQDEGSPQTWSEMLDDVIVAWLGVSSE